MNYKKLMKKAIAFHGHSCPGVALGVMAAGYILDQGNKFSIDEELVRKVRKIAIDRNTCQPFKCA